MDAYALAECRLLLDQSGHADWTIKAESNQYFEIEHQEGNEAFMKVGLFNSQSWIPASMLLTDRQGTQNIGTAERLGDLVNLMLHGIPGQPRKTPAQAIDYWLKNRAQSSNRPSSDN